MWFGYFRVKAFFHQFLIAHIFLSTLICVSASLCVHVYCVVCVNSLSLGSWVESVLTGVGSLQERLKLFDLRSANASAGGERESRSRIHTHTHTLTSPQTGHFSYTLTTQNTQVQRRMQLQVHSYTQYHPSSAQTNACVYKLPNRRTVF